MDNGRCNGNGKFFSDDFIERMGKREMDTRSTAISSSSSISPSSSINYIEHRVSKMDTLAGVAIKYGVEVADIKRLNGLVTDLQMFAHKSLQIPLPGRHPPSPILENGSASLGDGSIGQSQHRGPYSEVLETFQSLRLKPSHNRRVSPAMSTLQGYYGLTPPPTNRAAGPSSEGTEMKVYRTGKSKYLEDGQFSPPKTSQHSDPSPTRHRKSRSMVNVNGLLQENGDFAGDVLVIEAGDSGSERSNEKSVRRRQKSDADPPSWSPELILKEDNSGGLLGRIGKGLSMRPKSSTKIAATDTDTARVLNFSIGDSFMADGFAGVRRSSSTSNLQEPEFSPIRPAPKWTLRPELPPLSAASITRPIFDGLPKPITGRRNKAALD